MVYLNRKSFVAASSILYLMALFCCINCRKTDVTEVNYGLYESNVRYDNHLVNMDDSDWNSVTDAVVRRTRVEEVLCDSEEQIQEEVK